MSRALARIVSILFHPLPAAAYLLLVVVALDSSSILAALGWAALSLGLSIGGPAIDLWLLVKARRVDDFHLVMRAQRPRVLAVSLGFTALAFTAVLMAGGPRSLQVALGVGLANGVVLTLITLGWKISLHAATVTGVVAVLWWRLGAWAALGIPLVLFVGWARIALRRHTTAQVAAGIAVAGGLSAVILLAAARLLR